VGLACGHLLQVYLVFVSHCRIRIQTSLSVLAALLVPEDVVDPLGDGLTDVVGLEGLSHGRYEPVGVLFSPLGQLHIVNVLLILTPAEVDLVGV